MKRQITSLEELKNFPFPLFEIKEMTDTSLVHKLPLKIFLSFDELDFFADGERYILRICEPKDTLSLKVYSWMGISLNAKHWYGKIILPPINFYHERGKEPPSLREINLTRKLRLKEIEEGGDRWKGYSEGRAVHSFIKKEDVVECAKNIQRRYFQGFRLIIKED